MEGGWSCQEPSPVPTGELASAPRRRGETKPTPGAHRAPTLPRTNGGAGKRSEAKGGDQTHPGAHRAPTLPRTNGGGAERSEAEGDARRDRERTARQPSPVPTGEVARPKAGTEGAGSKHRERSRA